jgi:hypothetical protein
MRLHYQYVTKQYNENMKEIKQDFLKQNTQHFITQL